MDPRWSASPWTSLVLNTWRQVSEHLDIAACLDELTPGLIAGLPLRRVWVRRFDAQHAWLETVAVSPWDRALGELPARRPLEPDELRLVSDWVSRGRVEPLPPRLLSVVSPQRTRGGVTLAGGLVDARKPVGIVLFEGDDSLAAQSELLLALLAPLLVALRNDQRVHELARLREAVEAENRALLSRLARDGVAGAVVGADAGMREVMARVQRVSQTDAPVLILGETGTGKELVAREVHARSGRAQGPFLKINCGGIPPELIDSELFGHERGSFTGAVSERRGWFERADGGTLFLDEIGELPLAAQVRLLRVLQDGTFERVGGQRPLHADVRILAATHRDLGLMVADGRFREDLWYRIGVFPLRLPPLRERLGDLPALVATFAARAGQRLFGRPLAATPDDLGLLSAYHWPGNVRELGAVVERAAILGDGHGLDVRGALGVQADAAPGRPGLGRAGLNLPAQRAGEPPRPPPPASTSLEEVNRRAIQEALCSSAGRIEGRGGAASRLGLSPSTLRSRMKRLDIQWDRFRPKPEDAR
ncbi:MAG: sigma-54-dependent Fis family transcriptional regulator [Deltaproteobacteria bacterium]|nr:sigma-54-dependent Fis family transcriptional regulator [Deltaproteobacteria bacterium]